jgi:hypothetical protein
MFFDANKSSRSAATVVEVLPMTGLAYLLGDDCRSWAITKSTSGVGLDALKPGKRVDLTIVHGRKFDIVTTYMPMESSGPVAQLSRTHPGCVPMAGSSCPSTSLDGQPHA